MNRFACSLACLRSTVSWWVIAALSNPLAAAGLDAEVGEYFRAYCLGCHSEGSEQSDFRIHTLSKRVGFEDPPQWLEVMERISSGEMPPEESENRPTAAQSTEIVQWLAGRMEEGEAERLAARDRVSFNRLTRDEYVNTIGETFGFTKRIGARPKECGEPRATEPCAGQ